MYSRTCPERVGTIMVFRGEWSCTIRICRLECETSSDPVMALLFTLLVLIVFFYSQDLTFYFTCNIFWQ